jgi:RND superfamily putative drug exporter
VIESLARTAGLITSAAAIVIAVFTACTVGSSLVVQMLGFTLAVAVFLDATVVRRLSGRHGCSSDSTEPCNSLIK